MKVYLLSTGCYSDWTILGIYATREKAEAEKHAYENPDELPSWWCREDHYRRSANDIEEYEVDCRVPCDYDAVPWK